MFPPKPHPGLNYGGADCWSSLKGGFLFSLEIFSQTGQNFLSLNNGEKISGQVFGDFFRVLINSFHVFSCVFMCFIYEKLVRLFMVVKSETRKEIVKKLQLRLDLCFG
eukprot:Sdes_comp20788_c0_seq1m16954